MTTVIPNPVRLTVASTAYSNIVGVKIYDNGVYLEGATNRVRFEGLYQNNVQIGNVSTNRQHIEYNGKNVLETSSYSGYTFSLKLRTNDLPNGDYVAVMRYTKNNVTKNYDVPIRIELT
ncbi:MAG: hypothetical protein U0L93_01510 [Bacteroidales bacterium]|nr:hypothetical protein [Bacteroidales bacterium]